MSKSQILDQAPTVAIGTWQHAGNQQVRWKACRRGDSIQGIVIKHEQTCKVRMPGSSVRWSSNVAMPALHSSGSCATSHDALSLPAEVVSQMICVNPAILLMSHLHTTVGDGRSTVQIFRSSSKQDVRMGAIRMQGAGDP